MGDTSVVVVAADYYSGGRLPGAAVTWQATARRGHYSPPGWDGFTFGEWTPWWWGNDGGDVFRGGGSWPADPATQLSWTGRTGEDGRHRLAVDVSGVEPLAPASIELEATVQDVNRQAITGRTALIEGIIGFFQPPRRDLLRQVWTKLLAMRNTAVELAKTKVTSAAMDEAIQRTLAATGAEIDRRLSELGKSSTSSPASSG